MTGGGAALLAACLACLCWSSWRWAASSGLVRAVDVLVAWGVLLLGTIVGTVLVVGGLLHALDAGPLAAAAAGTAALAGATTAGRGRRARVAAARRTLRGVPGRLGAALRSPLVLLLALAATAAVGYRVAIAVAFPALDWDGLGYHLPMVDFWLQQRRLSTSPFSFWAQIYPGAAETVVAWTGGLTGTVRAAAAVQIGTAALGALSVVGLCRGAGCTPRSSLVAGLLFLLTPLVLVQLSTAEVDVAAAATLLASWHLLLVALRRDGGRPVAPAAPREADERPPELLPRGGGVALAAPPVAAPPVVAPLPATARHRAPTTGTFPVLLLAGIGAGVAAGVKLTNLFAVGVLGLVLVGTVLWRGAVRDRAPGRAVARAAVRAAWFGVPAVALAGGWYVRNALLWGNPLYPLAVAGLPGDPDVVSAVGVDPRDVGTTNRGWAVLVSWASDLHWRSYFYGSATGGLGAQWLLVLLPATLVAFVLLLRARHRLTAWGLLLPGAVLLAAYPAQYHARYTLFLAGLGGVGLAVVLDRLPRLPRAAVLTGVTAAAVFSASAASWQALDVSGDFGSGPTPGAVVALMRAPAQERAEAGLRGAFTDVERAAPGSTVLVPPEFGDLGEPWVLSHSLWGDDLRRRVVASAEPIEDAGSALRALADHDAQYLVVTKGSPLETALLAAPGRMHIEFDVGWLAQAWAPGPG